MSGATPAPRHGGAEPARGGLLDQFTIDQPVGQVVGYPGPAGQRRHGVDVEGVLSIDHGALRIQPLLHAGWGRAGVVYGPFARQPGLTLAIAVLNGHNTAQAGGLDQSLKQRFSQWARGSQSTPVARRMLHWLLRSHKRRTLRQWRQWWTIWRRRTHGPAVMDENLALGWFAEALPADPRQTGHAFVVHATGGDNGELWARVSEQTPALIHGLQNIPLYYVIVLREHGAAYYAGAGPQAPYLPPYPRLRPLAIDTSEAGTSLYVGLFQSVLGQIGFRADTHVQAIQVEALASLAGWYGTAQAADRLVGDGPLAETSAEVGGVWRAWQGELRRSAQGVVATSPDSSAGLELSEPAGLIHVTARPNGDTDGSVRLIWRQRDAANYWFWELSRAGSQVGVVEQNTIQIVAGNPTLALTGADQYDLQIIDDGASLRWLVNGRPLASEALADTRWQGATGVGLGGGGRPARVTFRDFEVHARSVPMPAGLSLPASWSPPAQRVVKIRDDFQGPAGDLHGRLAPQGGGAWQRTIGTGVIALTGQGEAQVQASLARPNPGRTAYTLPWADPDYADLELAFSPPGTGPGEGHKSRAGVIFYQDADNFVIASAWNDDYYSGGSFAFFFHLNGFEELYDAVWSNVGRQVSCGVPVRARVVCQRLNLAVYLNDAPVLFRSLTQVYPDARPLLVRRVGLVVNWEWGNDTGTHMSTFTAAGAVH